VLPGTLVTAASVCLLAYHLLVSQMPPPLLMKPHKLMPWTLAHSRSEEAHVPTVACHSSLIDKLAAAPEGEAHAHAGHLVSCGCCCVQGVREGGTGREAAVVLQVQRGVLLLGSVPGIYKLAKPVCTALLPLSWVPDISTRQGTHHGIQRCCEQSRRAAPCMSLLSGAAL
jgi:hypothetical protein